MAASQQTEEDNYIKLFKLVTGVGTDALRESFDRFFPPSTLVADLKKNELKLKKLNYERRLTAQQMSILFPVAGSPTSRDFDVTLMICLIRNLTSVSPPANGFDKLPMQSETSVGADIARIKYYRNMLAHADTNRISEPDFQSYWKDLTDAIVRLGGQHYQAFCDEIKELTLVGRYELTTLSQQIEAFRSLFLTEITELKGKVDILEMTTVEIIPKHIQDQIEVQLKQWQEEDEDMFVSTTAADYVLKCLTEKNCVTVTGNPGVGKTFTVRHVALVMRQQGYTIVPTNIPKDIRDFTKPGNKVLFVIDDLCGHYSLNQHYLDDWMNLQECIQRFIDNNYCKIIATCRLQVYKDDKFKSLTVFTSCECNLSKELILTSDEKTSLANKYFEEGANEVIKLSNKFDFFPMLCRFYKKNRTFNLVRFFSNPFTFFEKELDNFLLGDDGSKHKYCVLALCVVFNNSLREEYLTDNTDRKIEDIIGDVLSVCRLNKGASPYCLYDSLQTLEDTYVVKENHCFKCVHDKLFDFLSFYIGRKMIKVLFKHADSTFIRERFKWRPTQNEDLQFSISIPDDSLDTYIDRMISDWERGNVYDFFDNRNLKSSEFTRMVIDRLNQHDTDYQCKLVNMTVDNEYNDTTLLQSCFIGDINLTQWILDHGAIKCLSPLASSTFLHINHCREDGTSPIYIACQQGHLPILNRLIERNGDINKCAKDGTSPIYIACQEGHLPILNRLIECNGDINKCKVNGASPIYIACQNGHLPILNRLIECNGDINKCKVNGASPIYIACQKGHLPILNRLIECNGDINKCMNDGTSPIYIACQNGHLPILNRLIECNGDINKCMNDGTSPLTVACYNGHINIVSELLKHKDVKIDICDSNGRSPLYWARYKGFDSIVKLLYDHGSVVSL